MRTGNSKFLRNIPIGKLHDRSAGYISLGPDGLRPGTESKAIHPESCPRTPFRSFPNHKLKYFSTSRRISPYKHFFSNKTPPPPKSQTLISIHPSMYLHIYKYILTYPSRCLFVHILTYFYLYTYIFLHIFLSNHFAITAKVQKGQEKFFPIKGIFQPLINYIRESINNIFESQTINLALTHSFSIGGIRDALWMAGVR